MMMNGMDSKSSYLTQEELKEIENVALRAPDVDLTWADVFAVKTMQNPHAKSGEYTLADADEGNARLLQSLSQAEKIFVSGQKVTYSVYTAGIAFELDMADIEASRVWGKPLDTEVIQRATRKVNEKINSMAYSGDSEFGVTGLTEASGVTAISGTDLDGYSGNVASLFITYFHGLPSQYRNRFPYSLVLADQEWAKLQKIGNTTNDKSIATQIQEAIPNLKISMPEAELTAGVTLGGGTTVADGTGLFVPKDASALRMAIAMSPRASTMDYPDTQQVKGSVWARIGTAELVFATAVGKITGLNG